MMRIIPTDPEDATFQTLMVQLEQRIADSYTIYPVDSRKAYESIILDGKEVHLRHRTFGVYQDGEATLAQVKGMCDVVFKMVCDTYPVGGDLIWRRRPTYDFEEVVEECRDCHLTSGRGWRSKVTLRLGGFPGAVDSSIPDGGVLPNINEVKLNS